MSKTETRYRQTEILVESWAKNNPEALSATSERARVNANKVFEESKIKPEQLLQRVTI